VEYGARTANEVSRSTEHSGGEPGFRPQSG
jgi:hypothetical protein